LSLRVKAVPHVKMVSWPFTGKINFQLPLHITPSSDAENHVSIIAYLKSISGISTNSARQVSPYKACLKTRCENGKTSPSYNLSTNKMMSSQNGQM